MSRLFKFLLLNIFILFMACDSKEATKSTVVSPKEKVAVEFYDSHVARKKNAPFSDAVRVGDILFLAGQVGYNNDSLKLAHGGIKGETRQALENIKEVLELHGSDIEHVVKCTVILSDLEDFSAFNEVFREYFPKNKPARTTFAADLLIGSKIEIEAIAVVK